MRTSRADIAGKVLKVKSLINGGGLTLQNALAKVKLSDNAWYHNKDKIVAGSMSANDFPPRPAKRAKGVRQLDMGSVKSLAARITALDARLAKLGEIRNERQHLAKRLMALLTKER